ncbi:MAG TPA: GNAT family N-acetyltransferase [Stellaceae bacterium]|jgi:hypothetical protein|nr:GNAT family N-acetyltransferase [Stellaceae bacterium]
MHHPRISSANIDVRIVRTPDEFAMAMAVRAAVFLAEEDNITYFDEFNGNDYAATQLIGFVAGDPGGVVRVRWFAEFALIERIGIRRRYRSYPMLSALAHGALNLCRQKGYRLVSGRARGPELVQFWKRFGGRPSGPAIQMFRGTLHPIIHDLEPRVEIGEIGPLRFGEPDFENLIAQVEGTWNFPNPAAPRELAAAE